ncbi:MAG: phosphatase PAP2 family protein [Rhodospirillales bacterium]|nr:MAG: phosphatase PAP2 family protein [Rhodospirillales bacterium]
MSLDTAPPPASAAAPLANALSRASLLAAWRAAPRGSRVVWLLVAAFALFDVVALLATGIRLAPGPFLLHLLAPVALLGIGYIYGATGRGPRIADTLGALGQLFAFTMVAGPASYLLIRMGLPMVDGHLAAADRALGLDWPAYARFTDSLPVWMRIALAALYASSVPQIMAVAAFLGFTGRSARLREFIGALALSALAVVVLGALLPALGAHHTHGVPDGGKAFFIKDIVAAHAGETRTLDLSKLTGLVVCPSFHTTISLLIIAATWSVRFVGPMALAVNAALLAGVPVYGSHHFVDMLAGAALTVAVLWIWRRWIASA